MERKKLGSYGENIARAYLLKHNYSILGQNFHSRFGEIDIIAQNQQDYVFIEVKTRINTSFGEPEESINRRKLIKIYKTVYHYLEQKDLKTKNIHWRIDLIAIKLARNLEVETLNHYQNIFI